MDWAPNWPLSHCEGSREPAMNNQITGTHKAGEAFGSLAGSNRNSATSRMNQMKSANEGDTIIQCNEGNYFMKCVSLLAA